MDGHKDYKVPKVGSDTNWVWFLGKWEIDESKTWLVVKWIFKPIKEVKLLREVIKMGDIWEILSNSTCLDDWSCVSFFGEKAIEELGVGVPKATSASSILGSW